YFNKVNAWRDCQVHLKVTDAITFAMTCYHSTRSKWDISTK
ncbi:hypothetical protein CISIN_1g0381692mg, partial [Citrus sinensis]